MRKQGMFACATLQCILFLIETKTLHVHPSKRVLLIAPYKLRHQIKNKLKWGWYFKNCPGLTICFMNDTPPFKFYPNLISYLEHAFATLYCLHLPLMGSSGAGMFICVHAFAGASLRLLACKCVFLYKTIL